jgi:hypothetical protein
VYSSKIVYFFKIRIVYIRAMLYIKSIKQIKYTEEIMNKYLMVVSLVGILLIFGCISQQEIPPAKRIADDSEKITRFDYMESRWSYMNKTWVTGKKVTPYVLMKTFNIPREQAVNEIKEFESVEESFSWFQRFFTYINLRAIRFYINPPQ